MSETKATWEDKVVELEHKKEETSRLGHEASKRAIEQCSVLVKDVKTAIVDGILASEVVLPLEIGICEMAGQVEAKAKQVQASTVATIESVDSYLDNLGEKMDIVYQNAYEKAIQKNKEMAESIMNIKNNTFDRLNKAKEDLKESMQSGKKAGGKLFSSFFKKSASILRNSARECRGLFNRFAERAKKAVSEFDKQISDAGKFGEDFQDMIPIALSDPKLQIIRNKISEKPYIVDPRNVRKAEELEARLKGDKTKTDYEAQLYKLVHNYCALKMENLAIEDGVITAKKEKIKKTIQNRRSISL